MRRDSRIESVIARQIFSDRGHPGVEATVATGNGARGIAVVTAGFQWENMRFNSYMTVVSAGVDRVW